MSATPAGVDVDAVSTTAIFALNDIAWLNGKAYRYVQAAGAITGDGYACSIGEDGQALMVDTDVAGSILEGDKVGIAETAFADNEYGWLQVFGPCGVLSEASALANKKLGPTSTAGQVDDAAATGIFINGLHFGAATGGTAAVNAAGYLNWPSFEVQMEPET